MPIQASEIFHLHTFLQVLPIKEDIKLNNNNKKRNINLINFIPNYTINPITISYCNS